MLTIRLGNQQSCSFFVTVIANSTPFADPVFVETKSSEPVKVAFEVYDNDGDQIALTDVNYDPSKGVVGQLNANEHSFVFTPSSGTLGVVQVEATICDDKSPAACSQVLAEINVLQEDITIYKAFSPNGDGINDIWVIGRIEQHPENSVIIFDRWGSIIYEASGYNNEDIVWDGRGNSDRISSRDVVPAGTYYYSIKIHGYGSKKGYIELIK